MTIAHLKISDYSKRADLNIVASYRNYPMTLGNAIEWTFFPNAENTSGHVLDFGPERGSEKGTMADLRPLGS